jgi:hypothetical protein
MGIGTGETCETKTNYTRRGRVLERLCKKPTVQIVAVPAPAAMRSHIDCTGPRIDLDIVLTIGRIKGE